MNPFRRATSEPATRHLADDDQTAAEPILIVLGDPVVARQRPGADRAPVVRRADVGTSSRSRPDRTRWSPPVMPAAAWDGQPVAEPTPPWGLPQGEPTPPWGLQAEWDSSGVSTEASADRDWETDTGELPVIVAAPDRPVSDPPITAPPVVVAMSPPPPVVGAPPLSGVEVPRVARWAAPAAGGRVDRLAPPPKRAGLR